MHAGILFKWVEREHLSVEGCDLQQCGHTSCLTCRITLSGWLKFGELVRAFPFLPGAEGHRPSNFLPHVRTLHAGARTHTHTHTHTHTDTHQSISARELSCCGGNGMKKAPVEPEYESLKLVPSVNHCFPVTTPSSDVILTLTWTRCNATDHCFTVCTESDAQINKFI